MITKLLVIALSATLLGGCTLLDSLKTSDAAKDQKSEVVATSTPTPTSSPDSDLESMPTTSNSSDVDSLEADINATTIIDEDFSDLN